MFQRRLTIFIALLLLALGILLGRLGWLQIIEDEKYLELSLSALELPAQWLETVRGTIYDCKQRPLALDKPSYELCFHYRLTRLYNRHFWRYQQLKWARSESQHTISDQAELENQLQNAEKLLADLAEICDIPREKFKIAIQRINDNIYALRISRARRRLYAARGLECKSARVLAIEEDLVAMIPDEFERLDWIYQPENNVAQATTAQKALTISEDLALMLAERFVGLSFTSGLGQRPVIVNTGKTRTYPYDDLACHIIGQMRPASPNNATETDNDPPRPEKLRAYHLGDRIGEWGVEYMFEPLLRGSRGSVRYDREGKIIGSRIEPIPGEDITLTIDIELAQMIQHIFQGANVQERSWHGAAVVIDVPTGRILALVSEPTFDLNTYYLAENFDFLNIDGRDPARRRHNRALSRATTHLERRSILPLQPRPDRCPQRYREKLQFLLYPHRFAAHRLKNRTLAVSERFWFCFIILAR